MTNAESAQASSRLIVTIKRDYQPLFCDSQNLSKTITTKLYPANECEKKHKEQCIKNQRLSDNIYSIANL